MSSSSQLSGRSSGKPGLGTGEYAAKGTGKMKLRRRLVLLGWRQHHHQRHQPPWPGSPLSCVFAAGWISLSLEDQTGPVGDLCLPCSESK